MSNSYLWQPLVALSRTDGLAGMGAGGFLWNPAIFAKAASGAFAALPENFCIFKNSSV